MDIISSIHTISKEYFEFMKERHDTETALRAEISALKAERDSYIAKSVDLQEHLSASRKIVDEQYAQLTVAKEALNTIKDLRPIKDTNVVAIAKEALDQINKGSV
jgi:uncharacterized coiled-coil DUF342 family protein